MHKRILLIRFADFTTKRTSMDKIFGWLWPYNFGYSTLLCLHYFDYVYIFFVYIYIAMSTLLWICLHYFCYDYIIFVYIYITTLLWICLHFFNYVYITLDLSTLLCPHDFWYVFITSVMTTFSLFISTLLRMSTLHLVLSTLPLWCGSTYHPVCVGSSVIVCWSSL